MTSNNCLFHGSVIGYLFNVRTEISQDFNRQVAKWSICSLENLSRVAACHGQTEIFSNSLHFVDLWFDCVFLLVRGICKSVEVIDQTVDIWVVGVWLETKLVLEGDGECENHVDGGNFCEQVLFTKLALAFICVDPNITSEISALYRDNGPGLSAIRVTFVCCAASEGQGQTDDETKDCKERVRDTHYVSLSDGIPLIGDIRGFLLSTTKTERQVMSVAHPPAKVNGRIMRGKTLPCIRRK